MQFVVKFTSIAAIVFFFASCHNDVPGLPTAEEVHGYKYCKYTIPSGEIRCKSTYQISEKNCADINFPPDDTLTLEQKKSKVLFCDTGCTKKVCEE